MDGLPGRIQDYVFFNDPDNPGNETLRGSYYYTTADSLDKATADNTQKITNADEFGRQFSARLYVSNIINRVIVQKVDQNGTPINGAVMALYAEDQVIQNVDGTYTLKENAQPLDGRTGTTRKLVKDQDAIDLEGAVVFANLEPGTYYAAEKEAPEGYVKSNVASKIVVNNKGVYADAGVENDGLTVTRGVGRIVRSMVQFATDDNIDTTLNKIVATPQTGDPGTEEDGSDAKWEDVVGANKIHLRYQGTGTVLDYGVTEGTNGDRRYKVDEGTPNLKIEQCQEHKGELAQDIKDTDISSLFTGVTIVTIENVQVSTLDVSKQVENAPDASGNAEFSIDVTFTHPVAADAPEGTEAAPLTQAEANRAHMQVAIGDDSHSVTVSGDGTVTVKLRAGETAHFTNVPTGLAYEVSEQKTAGYDPSYEGQQGTIEVGKLAEAIVTNTYSSTGALELSGTKKLVGRDWVEGDSFEFTLTGKNVTSGAADDQESFTLPTPAEATLRYEDAVKVSGGGNPTENVEVPFSFGDISFSQKGTYEFTITETKPGESNVSNTSGLSVTYTYEVTDDGKGNLIAKPVETSQAGTSGFVNTYEPDAATAGLTATKTVNGESKGVEAGSFAFAIEAQDGAPLPDGVTNGGDGRGTVSNAAGGSVDFGTFTFGKKGTYVYRVSEVNGDKLGYGYDGTSYTVVFDVKDDPAKGALEASRTIYKGDDQIDAAKVESISFANTYHPTEAVTPVEFSGTKTVSSEHGSFDGLKEGQFSFEMKSTQAPAGVTAPAPSKGWTVTNAANGSFDFGTLTFAEPGEYTYTVSEVRPTDAADAVDGITYDGTVYTLYFNVVDNNGALWIDKQTITSSAGGSADAGNLDFANIYNDGEVSYQITGTKTLDTGGFTGESLAEGAFEFALVGEDGKVIQTVKNAAPSGNSAGFAFDAITYTEPGTHTYKVYEVGTDGTPGTGGTEDGVTYSKEVYTVTVVVEKEDGTAGAHGGLKVSGDIENAGGDAADSITFTNTYQPAPASVVIEGVKNLNVAEGSDRALEAGEFSFALYENGTQIDEATNNADGMFSFGSIEYNTVGTRVYTVRELDNGLAGVAYDETVYTVTVEVTENAETNALEAKVSYEADGNATEGVVFNNGYQAQPTEVTLGALKKLVGGDLAEGQFSFELTASEGAPLPEQTTAANAADGSVSFGVITFDKVGEYDYTIAEVNDGQNGVTYDENAARQVHVSVTDDGVGHLVAEVTYDAAGVAFTNTYTPPTPEELNSPGTPEDPGSPDKPGTSGDSTPADVLPQTGDSTPVALAGGVAVAALAVLVLASVKLRRSARNRNTK